MDNLYKIIKNSIVGVFSNYLLKTAVLRDHELITAVSNSLGCLYYIEKHFPEAVNKKIFKKLSVYIANNTDEKLQVPSFDNEKMDEEELEATHNYLYTYIKNIYRLPKASYVRNISDPEFVKFLKNDPLEDTGNATNLNSIDQEKTTVLGSSGLKLADKQPYQSPLSPPTGTGYSKNENEVLIKNANGNVVLNTNFYPYDKKPKVIPILKIIIGIFCALIAALSFATIIFIIVAPLLAPGAADPSSTSQESQPPNALVSYLFGGFEVVFFAYFAYIFLRPTKISRIKYTLSIFLAVIFWLNCIVNIFIISIPPSGAGSQPFFRIITDGLEQSTVDGFNAINIANLSFIVLSFILTVVIVINNPKINREKLMKLVEGQEGNTGGFSFPNQEPTRKNLSDEKVEIDSIDKTKKKKLKTKVKNNKKLNKKKKKHLH